MTKLSRRDFLKLAGATSAGLALSACGVKSAEIPQPTSTALPSLTPMLMPSHVPTATITPEPTATVTPKVFIEGVGEVTPKEGLVFTSTINDYKKAYVLLEGQVVRLKVDAFSNSDGTRTEIALTDNGIPLLMKGITGEWGGIGYKDLAPSDFHVASSINTWTGPNLTNKNYIDTFMNNFNMGATEGILDYGFYSKIPAGKELAVDEVIQAYDWSQFDEVTKFLAKSKKPYLLANIFAGFIFTHVNAPDWMRKMSNLDLTSWFKKHLEAIAKHLSQNGIPEPLAISVVNELLWHAHDRNAISQVWFEGDYLYSRLHDNYIKTVFMSAKELWPSAVLLLNDDNATEGVQTNTPLNAEGQVEFNYIKKMRLAGAPIDGFGSQSHLLARNFIEGKGTPEQNFDKNIQMYKQQLVQLIDSYKGIGVKFYFTELDVNIGGLPTDWSQKQKESLKAQLYAAVYETALNAENCDTVNTQGFTNESSWILDSKDYPYKPGESPLPLDESFKPTMSAFEIKKVLFAHRK